MMDHEEGCLVGCLKKRADNPVIWMACGMYALRRVVCTATLVPCAIVSKSNSGMRSVLVDCLYEKLPPGQASPSRACDPQQPSPQEQQHLSTEPSERKRRKIAPPLPSHRQIAFTSAAATRQFGSSPVASTLSPVAMAGLLSPPSLRKTQLLDAATIDCRRPYAYFDEALALATVGVRAHMASSREFEARARCLRIVAMIRVWYEWSLHGQCAGAGDRNISGEASTLLRPGSSSPPVPAASSVSCPLGGKLSGISIHNNRIASQHPDLLALLLRLEAEYAVSGAVDNDATYDATYDWDDSSNNNCSRSRSSSSSSSSSNDSESSSNRRDRSCCYCDENDEVAVGSGRSLRQRLLRIAVQELVCCTKTDPHQRWIWNTMGCVLALAQESVGAWQCMNDIVQGCSEYADAVHNQLWTATLSMLPARELGLEHPQQWQQWQLLLPGQSVHLPPNAVGDLSLLQPAPSLGGLLNLAVLYLSREAGVAPATSAATAAEIEDICAMLREVPPADAEAGRLECAALRTLTCAVCLSHMGRYDDALAEIALLERLLLLSSSSTSSPSSSSMTAAASAWPVLPRVLRDSISLVSAFLLRQTGDAEQSLSFLLSLSEYECDDHNSSHRSSDGLLERLRWISVGLSLRSCLSCQQALWEGGDSTVDRQCGDAGGSRCRTGMELPASSAELSSLARSAFSRAFSPQREREEFAAAGLSSSSSCCCCCCFEDAAVGIVALQNTANCFLHEGDFEPAAQCLKEATALVANSGRWDVDGFAILSSLALALHLLGHVPASLDVYERILEMCPSPSVERAGQEEASQSLFSGSCNGSNRSHSTAARRDRVIALSNFSVLYREEGHLDLSLQLIDKAINEMDRMCGRVGTTEALPRFSVASGSGSGNALSSSPQSLMSSLLSNKALVLLRMNDKNGALLVLQKAVDVDPLNQTAVHNLRLMTAHRLAETAK